MGASWNTGASVWSLLGHGGMLPGFTCKGYVLCIIFLLALACQNASAKTCVPNFANYWSGNMWFFYLMNEDGI